MTLTEGKTIATLAKAKGYAVQAEAGKVRFVTIEYAKNGTSTVTPRTDWLTFDQAMEIIKA
jgi:hypothetical protein